MNQRGRGVRSSAFFCLLVSLASCETPVVRITRNSLLSRPDATGHPTPEATNTPGDAEPTIAPSTPTPTPTATAEPTPGSPQVVAGSWSTATVSSSGTSSLVLTLSENPDVSGVSAASLQVASDSSQLLGATSCSLSVDCSSSQCTIQASSCSGTGRLVYRFPALSNGAGSSQSLLLPELAINNLVTPVATGTPPLAVANPVALGGTCTSGTTVRAYLSTEELGSASCSGGAFSLTATRAVPLGLSTLSLRQEFAALLSSASSVQVSYDGALVLGQSSFTAAGHLANGGMSYPYEAEISGNRLVVADTSHSRVLIWNDYRNSSGRAPDVVLGQASLSEVVSPTSFDASSLGTPVGIALSGSKLIVTDYSLHRVLIWNTIPTVNNQPADVVLGQPDFTSVTDNNGGRSASTLKAPYWVIVNDGKLILSDGGNRRVLIWNSIPTISSTPADRVVGQADFTSAVSAVDASHLGGCCIGIAVWNSRLVLSDYYNARVLVFPDVPSAPGAAATVVLGQHSLTANVDNNDGTGSVGSPSASTLSWPGDVAVVGGKLVVQDYGNSRHLVWNSVPTSHYAPADAVIGVPDFSSSGATQVGSVGWATKWPWGLGTDGTSLAISDYGNHRVVVHASLPTARDAVPSYVFGQATPFTFSGPVSLAAGMVSPAGLLRTGDSLWVSDYQGGRTLVWNPFSGLNFASATASLSPVGLVSSFFSDLRAPSDIAYSGRYFVQSEQDAHRVLVWDGLPSASYAPTAVLGQPDINSSTSNNGGLGAGSLTYPNGVASDGTRLAVADSGNNRVLIWNTIPTSNQRSADVVLGQSDFTSATANAGGLGAATLSGPSDVIFSAGKLLVLDSGNSRILVWNTVPSSNGVPADLVLGQANFTSGAANAGGIGASTLSTQWAWQSGLDFHEGILAVGDTNNHRVLGWKTFPTVNGQAADFVIGQANFTANSANRGGSVSQQGLKLPNSVLVEGGNIWISDAGNSRVVRVIIP